MIKLKSILVIILSSIVISAVILLTIFGISLYTGWKEKESAGIHRERISQLNARDYGQYVKILSLKTEYVTKGIDKRKCFIKGIIKNNGYRTIASLGLRVEFLNASGSPIHVEKLLPLKASTLRRGTTIAALSLFTSGKELPLLPGESTSFVHLLTEQKDKDVISPIKHKRYATNPNEWSGKFNYKITEIRF
ncbi:MAG: hypothetical protein ISS34_07730 [Candidatus Omnitrophica bacterium]|nr:hypothetical protein [Candidatus Omnitrophota bacterium]